jgi:serine/threonine-protein kinase
VQSDFPLVFLLFPPFLWVVFRDGYLGTAIAVALIAVIALVATTSMALFQSRDARHQAARAESVRNFLLDLFKQADPDRIGEKPLTARELIDAGAQRVQRGLRGDPDTRVELLGVVGNLYASLGQASAAADIYEARLAEAQRLYATGDPREVLARLDLAQSESERDHFDRARDLVQGALAALDQQGTGDALLRADAYARLGWIEKRAGRYEQAAGWQQRRIALLRIAAPGGIALAGALDDFGAVQHIQAHYDQSAQSYREALRIAEARNDAPPSLLLGIRYDLALAEHESGHFEQAAAVRGNTGLHHPLEARSVTSPQAGWNDQLQGLAGGLERRPPEQGRRRPVPEDDGSDRVADHHGIGEVAAGRNRPDTNGFPIRSALGDGICQQLRVR